MKLRFLPIAALLLATLFLNCAFAQPKGYNYDESKVPKYTLPDPLVCLDGTKVTDKATWLKKRRPEIVKLFEEQVYGRSPKGSIIVELVYGSKGPISDGLGTVIETHCSVVRVANAKQQNLFQAKILLILPKKAKKRVPVFLALNFRGNHTIHHDPSIYITKSWVRNDPKNGTIKNRANEKTRGFSASRWPVKKILKRGYGLATVYYGEIIPDHKDGLKQGPHRHFLTKRQTVPADDEWGAIAGWAWGLSRILDALAKEEFVDPKRVIVMGHSRLGKTALWAGAIDPRFAMVISNDSGCGGAALSRRAFGETVKRINTSFPHWFCGNFKKYNDNEDKLPVDQHMLVSLIAPRPVYIASAQGDRWADPRGEFLSALHANPVYRLLGTKGLPAKTMPGVNKPTMGRIGYHIRTGKHDVTAYDWEQYLKFADKHLKKKK